ncbi:hypothetical protein ACIPY5_00005, partial [Microbacterium sp. NPDC089698]
MKNKRTLQQLAVAGVIAVIAALATPAMAVAAPNPAPGAAKAPTLMFEETFENQQQTAAGPLASYAGTSGTTYTADAQWLMASACNGILVMSTSTFADDQCTGGGNPRENVRALADALGGATNHAVTAYTHQGHPSTPGATLLVESQKSGVTLKENRFYVSSIDLAEVNCVIGATHSAIQFGLETAGGEVIMDPTPAVVCAGATSDAPQVGTRTSDGFMPSASQAGAAQYIARNLTVSGQGNDFAYDNLRLF